MAETLHSTIRRAQRRELAARAVRLAGWWLILALILGLGLLVVDRLTALRLGGLAYVGIAATGIVAGFVHALLRRPHDLAVAVKLDHALGLKDRIGSAVTVHDEALRKWARLDEGFAQLVRRDAEALAGRVDVDAATPIHFTSNWFAAAGLGALLIVGVVWLPQRDAGGHTPLTPAAAERAQAVQQESQAVAQTIQDALHEVAPAGDTFTDEAITADLAALDRLAAQLSGETRSEAKLQAAKDQSAARMNELAARLEDQAQRDRAAAEEIVRRFEGLDAIEKPDAPLTTQELEEAIRTGRFGKAADEIERLLDEGRALPEADRRAAAEALRELSDAVEQRSNATDDLNARERRAQLRDALREQGLPDEAIDSMLDQEPQSADEVARELREQGIDEEAARQLAQEMQRQQDERERQQTVDQDVRDVAEALDRAADEVESPPPPPPAPPFSETPPPSPAQSQAQPGKRDREQRLDERDEARPETASRPGAEPTPQKPPAEGDQSQPQQPGDARTPRPEPQAAPTPNRDQPQAPKPNDRQPSQQDKPEQRPGDPASQQKTDEQRTGESSSPQQQGEPKPGEGTAPQQQTQKPEPGAQAPEGKPAATAQRQPQQPPREGEQSKPWGARPTDSPQPPAGAQPQPSGDAKPNPSQPQRTPDATSPPTPGDQLPQPDDQPGNQPSGVDPESDRPSEEELDRQLEELMRNPPPAEVLRELAERARRAEDQPQLSERLREKARALADNMTPEQRQRWEEALRREAGDDPGEERPGNESGNEPRDEPGAPPDQFPAAADERSPEQRRAAGDPSATSDDHRTDRGAGAGPEAGNQPGAPAALNPADRIAGAETDTIDLRGEETADQLIVRWLSDEPAGAATGVERSAGAAPQQVRSAQKVAERAVNDAAVHKRYHRAIKRYFGRLEETIEKAAQRAASPVDSAKPATGRPPDDVP